MTHLSLLYYFGRFFNDALSGGAFTGILHILRAFYDGDAYLALPLGSQYIDEAVSLLK